MDGATEQANQLPTQLKPNLTLLELMDFLEEITKGDSVSGSTFTGNYFNNVSSLTKFTISFADQDQQRVKDKYINQNYFNFLLSLVRSYLLKPENGQRVLIRELATEENKYSQILFATKPPYLNPDKTVLTEMAVGLRNLVRELVKKKAATITQPVAQTAEFHLADFRADIRQDVLASWDRPNPHLFSMAGVKALAKSLAATAINPEIKYLIEPVDNTGVAIITVVEARYVFDQFSDSIQAWVNQAINSGRTINTPLGPRGIRQLLTPQELETITNITSQPFYFRAADPTLLQAINLEQKSNQDDAAIKAFLEFFGTASNKDGLIAKLRGDSSQLPALPVTATVTPEPAAEGGEIDREELPETQQAVEAVIELLTQKAVAELDTQLQFQSLLAAFGFELNFYPSLLNALALHLQTEFETELADLITAAQQSHPVSSVDGVTTGFYDQAAGSFITNGEFEAWLSAAAREISSKFADTYPDQKKLHTLVKTLLRAIETAENEIEVENEVARIDTAYVPDNLEELLELYYIQAFPEQSETIPFSDWWLSQPLSERRRYLQSWQPDSYHLFDAYAHAIGNQVLTEYFAQFDLGIHGFNATEFLRANPLLASEFKDFLFELNPELLQRLASKNSTDRLSAYREVLQRFKTTRLQHLEAVFQLRATAENFLLAKVGSVVNPDQPALGNENAQNIASSVFAYSLTNKGVNALGVVDGLSDDDLAKTYGVSEQQAQQFRDSLKLLLQARYGQNTAEGETAVSPAELALLLQLARQHGGQRLIGALSTRYGEYDAQISSINADDQLNERERLQQVTNVVLERQLAASVYQGSGVGPGDEFIAGEFLQDAGEQLAPSRLQQFWNNLRGQQNQTVKDKALHTMADPLAKTVNSAVARGIDSIIPGLGMGTEALLALLPPEYRKYGLLGILAAIGGLIGYAGNLFATTLGGFLGGVTGGVVGFLTTGPAGAIPGWMAGTYSGWGVGQLTGLNNLNPSQLVQSLFSGSSATGTAGFGLPTGGVVLGSAALVGTAGLLNQSLLHNAFLHSLPTISGDEISPYITIIKQAQPGTNFSENPQFPQQIVYSVEIRANEGYRVIINTASIKDTLSVSYNKKAYETAGVTLPSGAPIQGKTRTFADLAQQTNCALATTPNNVAQFGDNPSTITLEGETTLVFPVYCETYDESFNHANVINSFELTFSAVASPTGDEVTQSIPVVENEKAETAEVICFGECPQFQNGCWPTTGYVQQTTANESGTHSSIWAIDIRNTIGTPIYTPFAADNACAYTTTGSGGIAPIYGNHVTTQIQPGVAFDKGFTLLYGHMHQLSDTLNPNACSQPVLTGQQIGTMGISGLSVLGGVYNTASNSHLHYEIRTFSGNSSRAAVTADDLDIEKIIPEGEMVLSRFVRSCYDTKWCPTFFALAFLLSV